jgi:hypothetical protein
MENDLKHNMDRAVEEMLVVSDWKDRKYKRLQDKYETNRQAEQKQFISDTLDDMLYEIEEQEDEKHWKLYKAKTSRRLKLTAVLMSLVMLAGAIGFAWYAYQKHEVKTENMSIMTPYTLYLLNPGAEDYLTLSIGDLHPGETKQIVVCVSSHDVGGTAKSKQGVFSYQMELAYTDNLKLSYQIYPLTPVEEKETAVGADYITSEYTTKTDADTTLTKTFYFQKTYTDPAKDALAVSSDSYEMQEKYRKEMYKDIGNSIEDIVNLGNYQIYDTLPDGGALKLNLGDSTNQYNYYLIEVTVDPDIDINSYKKETDLIYLIAKAKLPKAEEITSAAQESSH